MIYNQIVVENTDSLVNFSVIWEVRDNISSLRDSGSKISAASPKVTNHLANPHKEDVRKVISV